MPQRTTRRLDATPASIAAAADILRSGGLVAMPTETVYGLAANALDRDAVASIFAAKERPDWDPLIVHVASDAMLRCVVEGFSLVAEALANAFWPGPLTMLLPRSAEIGDLVTAGRPLVGVRWPGHPVSQELIRAAGVPLAAPSANRFGHVSPSTAAHVLADLDGRIDAVVDGGATEIGLESTVLDPNTVPVTIYRQGAVTAADVERVTRVPGMLYQPESGRVPQSLPSPGVGIRHYAPRTPVQLVHSREELRTEAARDPANTAVLQPRGWNAGDAAATEPWGDWNDTAELAHRLYAGLRALDACRKSVILVPLPEERSGDDLRSALRDRLMKAAMPRLVE